MKAYEIETFTVQDLIDELSTFQPHDLVCFEYNYGDKHGTLIAGEIKRVSESHAKYSAYHRGHQVIRDEMDADGEAIKIVLLR